MLCIHKIIVDCGFIKGFIKNNNVKESDIIDIVYRYLETDISDYGKDDDMMMNNIKMN